MGYKSRPRVGAGRAARRGIGPKGRAGLPEEVASLRIPEMRLRVGNREAQSTIPQSFWDNMYVESEDPLSHPSLGTYTHTAVKSGNWSDPSVWSTGTVPGNNAIVNVTSPYTVTYDVVSLALIIGIHVGGRATFKYATNTRTLLWVETIFSHGTYIHGELNNPVRHSGVLVNGKVQPMSEVVFWQNSAPGQTVKLGLVTMGPVRMLGAKKKMRFEIVESVAAGAVVVKVDNLIGSNLQIGDDVVVLSTEAPSTSASDPQYSGPTSYYASEKNTPQIVTRTYGYMNSQDEQRTIIDLNFQTDEVTFGTPLAYQHNVNSSTLPDGTPVTVRPRLAVLTHSIRYRSADASDTNWVGDLTDLQKRAHIMLMHCDNIDVRYVESKNMGRTDTNPSMAVASVFDETYRPLASNGGAALANANNVRGRYSWHLHGLGAFIGMMMAKLIGLTAYASQSDVPIPGWVFTHHNSRAAIEDCNAFNFRGAAFVSENGNETGQWINNTAIWGRGDGFPSSWGGRAEGVENHNGSAGIGFEGQARQILNHGNIYSSCHIGWFFMQQNVNVLKRIPDQHSLRYRDPIAQGGKDGIVIGDFANDNDTYGIEQAQIPDFNDNIGFSSRRGFAVAHRQYPDRGDQMPMIARRNHTINVTTPYDIVNYTHNYSFYDAFHLGAGKTVTDVCAVLADNSQQMIFVNCKIKRFSTGFKDDGLGHNHNGFWAAKGGNAGMFEDVTTPFDNSKTYQVDGAGNDATANWFWNLMGSSALVSSGSGTYTFKPRLWVALDPSAFPQPFPSTVSGIGAGGIRPTGYENTPPPFFVLDNDAVVTITANGLATMDLHGVIVDAMGVRKWPSFYTGAVHQAPTVSQVNKRTNHYTTGTRLVERNACWNDNGVWKVRLWFNDHERLSGDHFQFYIDAILSGPWNTDFLLANQVLDPNSTKPQLPLLPEEVGDDISALVIDTTPPNITSSGSLSFIGGNAFSSTLKANQGHVSYSIVGGADAALFTISGNTLSMTTKSYGSPQDADANNYYLVRVRCTNSLGFYTEKDHSIECKIDTAFQSYDFSLYSDQDITALGSGAWFTRVGGASGAITVTSGKLAINNTGGAIYVARDLGSRNQKLTQTFANAAGAVVLRYTNSTNYMYFQRRFDSTFRLVQVINGVADTRASWSNGNAAFVLELNGDTARLLIGGVEVAPTSGSGLTGLSTALTGTQWGIAAITSTSTNLLTTLQIEAMVTP